MENINRNIRFLREKQGWTQTQLARKLGISKSMIGAYEEFRTIPLLQTTIKLADLFEIDLDTLVRKDLGRGGKL